MDIFPFEQSVTDFFNINGNDFLVYADNYSGWIEVAHMHKKTAGAVIEDLRRWFITFGVPSELCSDGGPPFQSGEYIAFLKAWGVKQRLSSAYYPQGNGRAELAVKAAKRILATNISASGKLNRDSAAGSILLQRNTPVHDFDQSPAMILYGCNLKDQLPSMPVTM